MSKNQKRLFAALPVVLFLTCLTFYTVKLALAENAPDPVKTKLKFSKMKLQPGEGFSAVLKFEIKEGWHIYSKDPGDVGLPTKFNLNPVQNISAGEINWPIAQKYSQEGNISYNGYEGALELNLPLTVSSTAEKGSQIEIELSAKWAACSKDLCVPGRKTFKQLIEIGQ